MIYSDRNVHPGSGGNVIDNDRNFHSPGNGTVVGHQPFLSSLIIIGTNYQQRVNPRILCSLAEGNGVFRIVGAGSGDDSATVTGVLFCPAEQLQLLSVGKGGGFSGGSANHSRADSGFHLPPQELFHHGIIDFAI